MLPKCFKPDFNYDLIRLGKDNDGGYLVSKESVLRATALIGMGISADWSFEEEFLKINEVPINAYDHTVGHDFFRKSIKKSYYKIFPVNRYFKRILYWNKVYKSYNKFFSNNKHYLEKIGSGKYETSFLKSLQRIRERSGENAQVFLKIDIEGGEYDILEELVEYDDFICGLVLEFHHVDKNLEKIENFINRFSLTLIHVHANNAGGVNCHGVPLAIEITFSKYLNKLSSDLSFPHEYDQKNIECINDIALTFVD